jgi:Zn-dependent M28 family amino/carboxypeptidase
MKHLLVLILFVSTCAQAHDDHDWRLDTLAYLSVNYQAPLMMKRRSNIDAGLSTVDMKFFREKLEVFAGIKPFEGQTISERRSQKSLDVARSFLTQEYQAIGFETSLHVFSSGTNFIAEKKGTKNPEKVLILSSHIDSVGNRGANDNGTGTIGLLTLAKELSKKEFSYTIRILGFDREEVGIVGSDAYLATLKDRENIIGNINFEMMGVNRRDDGAFHVIDCNRAESLFLSQSIKDVISSEGLALSIVNTCTTRSDHASFWRRNIPAIVISENFFGGDADPCYHDRCDVMDDRFNFSYMGKILSAVLRATQNIVN